MGRRLGDEPNLTDWPMSASVNIVSNRTEPNEPNEPNRTNRTEPILTRGDDMRSAATAVAAAVTLVAVVMALSSAAQFVRMLTTEGVDIPGDAAYSCIVTEANGVPDTGSRNCH